MKTSDLIGPALDYSVAKAQDRFVTCAALGIGQEITAIVLGTTTCLYSPSTDWAQGGTLIERERIKVFPNVGGTWSAQIRHTESHPLVSHPVLAGWTNSSGPTPLIAAMRCFCASKLGDEVEIPEELK